MSSFSSILVPFESTNNFDKLVIDYLKEEPLLKEFYHFTGNLEGIKSRLASYYNPRLNRHLLKEVLLKQYNSYGSEVIIEKVKKNIELLEDEKTFTVTAGHQLNIFSGPLYVIFKLASCICLAEELKNLLPDYNFVPVYWMATEDHDIKEISSINLFGKSYEWNSDWKGSAGKMPLNGIHELITELKKSFGNTPFAEEVDNLIKSSYTESKTLGEATWKWINQLLGKYGLVIIDGNEPLLKKSIQDIFEDEIINRTSSTTITKTINALDKNYFSQAKPREINLFYMGDNFRERLVNESDNIRVLNTEILISKEKLAKDLLSSPEKLSPNVLLRPLYQVSILPDVVFVGGPAEISYWLELKNLFDYYKVPMPVLLLRSCMTILEKNIREKMEKLNFSPTDIFASADDLIKKYIKSKETNQPSFQNEIDKVSEEFKKLSERVSKIEPTLKAAVESESIKVIASLRNLEEKALRALKKKNETELNQIRKIKEKLFPNGKLQEREDSFLQYYLLWGNKLLDYLVKNMNPLEKKFIILEEISSLDNNLT